MATPTDLLPPGLPVESVAPAVEPPGLAGEGAPTPRVDSALTPGVLAYAAPAGASTSAVEMAASDPAPITGLLAGGSPAAPESALLTGMLVGGSPDAALESARVDSGVLGVGSLPEALAAALAGLEPGEVPPESWRVPYAASCWRAAVASNETGVIIAAEL